MAAWYEPRPPRKKGERDWPWVLLLAVEFAVFLLCMHYNIHA